ncbi:GBS Bsp-like repeat-containing protein [Streptococcus massiliensis]|nr:GBS Bsp-like repeat-containing protein [Streptococcus massiliensis]
MKKRNLIYLASTAVLMVASAQQVLADAHETTNSEAAVGATLTDKQAAAAETSHTIENTYSAPAVDPSEQKSAAKESQQPASETTETNATVPQKNEGVDETKDKKDEARASSAEKEPPSSKGESSFFDSHSTVTKPSKVEAKGSFVDVSSHNGDISVADYKELARQGVSGVVVKLTEGTFYKNPYAQGQIRNAQQAGLKVSAYAFSHYTNENEARAEAQYFAQRVRELNLPTATVLVNDIEDHDMERNINPNTQAWTDEMKRLGFSNLVYYTSAAWLDVNNLRNRGPIQTSKFGLQNFWVAQYPAGNLNVPKAQELNYNNGAASWQFTSQAQLLVGKHVFDQSLDYTGRFTTPVIGKISIVNNNSKTGSFDIVVSNVSNPGGVKVVKVPTWSTVNGQDDLFWYTAEKQSDGTYRAHVEASNHKNSIGEYNVHLFYLQNDGTFIKVQEAKTQVALDKPATGTVKIINNNSKTGSFDIVVSNVSNPGGVKVVKVPTWSTEGGQDDLFWYTAEKQSDGTYRAHVEASNHKNSIGEYNVHLFYLQNDGTFIKVQEAKTQVALDKPATGTVKIINNNSKTGSFDIVVSNVSNPGGVKVVKVPTWSTANGQDDLFWYTAEKQSDGTYRAHVEASNHKNSIGEYNVHLFYLQNDGTFIKVQEAKTQVALDKPATGTVKIINNNSKTGSFDIVVSNVSNPGGVKVVKVPTWSTANGQDDLFWYTAEKQSDGTYRAHVEASNHKNSVGEYNVHLFYLQNDGTFKKIQEVTTQVSKNTAVQATGKISIVNKDDQNGTFDIIVTEVSNPGGVKVVKVPTWSTEGGQDDLFWYTAEKQSDGTYRAHVDSKNHKNSRGEYNIHLYYYQDNHTFKLIQEVTTQVHHTRATGNISIVNKDDQNGTFDIVVTEVSNPAGGVQVVKVPTWSTEGGQDDLVWYTAVRQPDGSYRVHVDSRNHKNSTGEYNIHLYYYQDNHTFKLIQEVTTQVHRKYNTPYFSQRDNRWRYRTYGINNMDATGCVPTALAMAISGVKGKTVLPTEVADYLYNHTNSFNKTGIGTDGYGIKYGAEHWGLTVQALPDISAIVNTLEQGHHVLAAVGNSLFVRYPATHELVLTNYVNGRTYVRDPYNAANNGWYSVSTLVAIKSTDPVDLSLGSPFIAVK